MVGTPGTPRGGVPAPDGSFTSDGAPAALSSSDLDAFRAKVLHQGELHWRELPWRTTRDAYRVWLSEVMLQQTQVARVRARWDAWLAEFPSVQALAQAPDAQVLAAWQGMGYNRRALSLLRAARMVCDRFGGAFPTDYDQLLELPGVGPSTAAGVRAFAFGLPGVYLETNVRAVFIHELFPNQAPVADATLIPLVRATCPPGPAQAIRQWYYALLDYGAHLKRTVPNPTRRSRSYARQPRFEGSHRQLRALILRLVLKAGPDGASEQSIAADVDQEQLSAGRPALGVAVVRSVLMELAAEGFLRRCEKLWCAGSNER